MIPRHARRRPVLHQLGHALRREEPEERAPVLVASALVSHDDMEHSADSSVRVDALDADRGIRHGDVSRSTVSRAMACSQNAV